MWILILGIVSGNSIGMITSTPGFESFEACVFAARETQKMDIGHIQAACVPTSAINIKQGNK